MKARRVLAALRKIGWVEDRQRGSNRTLTRAGWAPYVWAFHDGDELGPVMLAKIGRKTGLTPADL